MPVEDIWQLGTPELRYTFGKVGVQRLRCRLREVMKRLEKQPLHVAVIGRSFQRNDIFIKSMCKALLDENACDISRSSEYTPIRSSDTALSLISLTSSYSECATTIDTSIYGKDVTFEKLVSGLDETISTGQDSDEGVVLSDDGTPITNVDDSSDSDKECHHGELAYTKCGQFKFWNIPNMNSMKQNTDDLPTFEAFLICGTSRFINQDEVKLIREFGSKKNIVFVYSTFTEEIARLKKAKGEECSQIRAYKAVHTYYRRKFFKHSIPNIPMFITANDRTSEFDFPDLVAQLKKWGRKRRHMRKKALERDIAAEIQVRRQQVETYVAYLASTIAFSTGISSSPIMPLVSDSCLLGLLELVRAWYFEIDLSAARQVTVPAIMNALTPSNMASNFPFPSLLIWGTREVTKHVFARTFPRLASSFMSRQAASLVTTGLTYIWMYRILSAQLLKFDLAARSVVDSCTSGHAQPESAFQSGRSSPCDSVKSPI